MKTEIFSLTVISGKGINRYQIGNVYNGLKLEKIVYNGTEFEGSIEFIHTGYTKEKDIVFEVVNAPIDVQYQPKKGE